MDKIARYRSILQNVIESTATLLSQGNQVAILPACDTRNDQYLMISLGWHKTGHREHAIVFHARLSEGKLLVEIDLTEEGVSPLLIEAGVDEFDIEYSWNRNRSSESRPSSSPEHLEAVAA
ncbi:MAG: XisI protein [Acidobacteria bacterium]|nr:XisI protein [Acidobacteriota bacterium]